MFKKILVAFDGSEYAQRAAYIAGEMARSGKDVELWLVCAMDLVPNELGKPYIDQLITERTHIGTDMLQRAKEIIGSKVNIHEELLFGSPAESIMNVAKNQSCDLIIMGTRGVGGLKGLLLGSQIQKVISLSKIPVLAVK
jgi:nucleotide-binding universal stress UspA family protein